MNTKPTGLRYWMLRVLQECDSVSTHFSADPVHDLRVALRRCRSMADGMMAMDPDRDWKAMKKAGKQLFQQLGALRDVQIMMDWIEKLELRGDHADPTAPLASAEPDPSQAAMASATTANQPHDPAAALLHILRAQENEHKQEARTALEEFDRKQWRQWSRTLPQRATRVRPGSAVFKHLALERWAAARDLHARAMRNRSQIALHTLRIGIKRFRYIVENFLPEEHGRWSNDLKHMQDLLGEVHDLDVLWATALASRVLPDAASRKAWHDRIVEERTKRIEEYRNKTTGPDSLWNEWRAALPQGNEIEEIATRRMKLWAKALDPDFAHAERVARLALEIHDGLIKAALLNVGSPHSPASKNGAANDARSSLYAAAVLHDVGKVRGVKGHHKKSLELIKSHGVPLGWKAENLVRAGLVARFHCGALPTRSHKALRDLMPDEQKTIIRLAAILRLANAFDVEHDGRVRRVRIANAGLQRQSPQGRTNGFLRKPAPLGKDEGLVLSAEGYAEGTRTAQAVAAERYLLETVLRRPVIVKPASGSRRPATGSRTAA